jgi:hypothetical protein
MSSESLKIVPFQLPLGRDGFRDALAKGMGRAPMHVARFGAADREDLLVAACVDAVAYDAQTEDDRTPWLLEMIDRAGIEASFVPRVLTALGRGFVDKSHWSQLQLCRLALVFARRGYPDAREALYSAMHKNPRSSDIVAADAGIADEIKKLAARFGYDATTMPPL